MHQTMAKHILAHILYVEVCYLYATPESGQYFFVHPTNMHIKTKTAIML